MSKFNKQASDEQIALLYTTGLLYHVAGKTAQTVAKITAYPELTDADMEEYNTYKDSFRVSMDAQGFSFDPLNPSNRLRTGVLSDNQTPRSDFYAVDMATRLYVTDLATSVPVDADLLNSRVSPQYQPILSKTHLVPGTSSGNCRFDINAVDAGGGIIFNIFGSTKADINNSVGYFMLSANTQVQIKNCSVSIDVNNVKTINLELSDDIK